MQATVHNRVLLLQYTYTYNVYTGSGNMVAMTTHIPVFLHFWFVYTAVLLW